MLTMVITVAILGSFVALAERWDRKVHKPACQEIDDGIKCLQARASAGRLPAVRPASRR